MAQTARTLRVLIVDGIPERVDEVAATVRTLGHEVIGEGVDPSAVAEATVEELPDVALVIVGERSEQSLGFIQTTVRDAACPVIAILDVQDRAFIDRAARLGIFAYVAGGGDVQELQSSMDIALERFAEYHALEGAFGRRAVSERAKGILMERHGIDEQQAFRLMREHARRTNRKMVDVAESILASHRLLSGDTEPTSIDETSFAKSDDDP